MTAALERNAVGTILKNWTTTQIAWPNRDFTPPQKASWISVTIQNGDAAQLDLAGPYATHRHPGMVVVQVFAPANWGDKTALDTADSVAALFRRQRVNLVEDSVEKGTIVFRSPSVRVIGVDGAFFQVNVSIPFVRDYIY